ncbi:ABC transporter ATP-binding protein [Candidatus Parcubacteria bacterium]|jgi:branched-chain amino acid transport system ATP-binding protein|nr:ABC transporter ATP-binding protein [Candidatus Parcubacteria bacterium]MBT3949275.1 ABC transporter ATP-binding protein [Candidatus Parcubacteria bacterium]
MLEIKNIKKSFGGVKAIKGSDFIIEKNKVTALIGPNGAGKTTLFDIIAGLTRPDEGHIIFEEKDITKKEPHKIANLGISRTFQQVRLFKNLTILDHLQMVEDNKDMGLLKNIFTNKKRSDKKYEQVLENFGIKRTLDTYISDLSYGQRKLLQIAMTLEKSHKLLMLDEPVAGVNKVIQSDIENLLLKLKEENETILLIDHDMEFVRKLADHVIALDAGVVICEGTPDKVLKNKKVLEAYLGE